MCHITNLTKMCNSVTVTLKEEHLVNADIKIPQHSLVTFKFLTKFLAFSLAFRLARESYRTSDIHLY